MKHPHPNPTGSVEIEGVAYAPFVDSTGIAYNGEALRTRMDRDGYLFVRGLYPREVIMQVRERLLAKAAAGGWLDPDAPVDAGIANSDAACKDPEDRYMAVFKGLWADETLHRLRTYPAVMALFERMFGEPALVHPMFVQRNIFPHCEDFDFTTKAHQDKVHIGGDTNYALWVPLGDCPLDKGPLAMAVGSHRHGVLETKVGTGAGGMDIAHPVSEPWVCGSFSAGDAIIFCDVTVHQALPNLTRELRQSFDARYQPLSQAVADKNLLTYAGTGTWEEVYATWESKADQFYWKALDLNVVPLDLRYYEQRDQMAFEMAEAGDQAARDALLRIVQRDANAAKRERAATLLSRLDAAPAH